MNTSHQDYYRLIDDIYNLGIAPNDTVLIHSSLHALGSIEGGACTLKKVMASYFLPK